MYAENVFSGSEEDTVWFDDTCLIVLHVAVMCVNLSANVCTIDSLT